VLETQAKAMLLRLMQFLFPHYSQKNHIFQNWIPAFAGMTWVIGMVFTAICHSSEGWNPVPTIYVLEKLRIFF
jgi:hypothetical protein